MKKFKIDKYIKFIVISLTLILIIFCIRNFLDRNEKRMIIDSATVETEPNEKYNGIGVLEDSVAESFESIPSTSLVNEEKEEFLSKSTVARDSEDSINEDYTPKFYLSDEELRLYTQKIFLDICRMPDKIDKYCEVFSEESIEIFKEIKWKDPNTKEFYDLSKGIVHYKGDDGRIYGQVSMDSKDIVWELDLDEGEQSWTCTISYAYLPENGEIEIIDNYFSHSSYRMLSSEVKLTGPTAGDRKVKEKEEYLKISTLAKNKEDVINEDYTPKLYLTDEELRLYTQKIFLDICRMPDKLDKYHEVLSEESIEIFKKIEWKYNNAMEFYDLSLGTIYSQKNDDIIYGNIVVDSKYAVWELVLEEGAEGKWALSIDYLYYPENGMIELDEYEFFISYN